MRSSSSTQQTPTAGQAAVASTRAALRRALIQASQIESLEGRRMLSSDPYRVGNTPVFTPSSSSTADVKDGPLAKGGSALVNLFAEYQKYVKKGGVRSRFQSGAADTYVIVKNRVAVMMRTRGSIDDLSALVKEAGGTVLRKNKAYKLVEAFVPISQADNLAANSAVMHIRPLSRAMTRSVGVGVNEAEKALKTDSVLTGFGVDGTGQTVGVISDSFDSTGGYFQDISTGDLPADVNVIRDDVGGTDEGRAMTQLVHDEAPGANLAFSTAGFSQLDFADSIRNLREQAGSTVIVDDVGFFEEPFFQRGVIDQAIDDVTSDGVTYLNSAGNDGYAGYQRKADYVADPTTKGGYLVDFDPGKGVDTHLNIHLNSQVSAQTPGEIFFQWDNAYNGLVGDVKADMDIYLYRKDAVVASSIDNNFATGVPTERFIVSDPGDYQIVIKVNPLQKGGALPDYYKFTAPGNGLNIFDARTDVEYLADNTTISSTFGHSLSRNNISVGAVPYNRTEAFGQFKDYTNEDFSSAGTGLDLFDENGNRLDKPTDIPGATISSVDGTQTTVADEFNPFFGTSAAAPDAAGLVALLRQISPDAGNEQIKQALIDSAKQHPLNGSAAGTYDVQGGWGLIDGVLAASRLDSTIPTARIDVPATSDGVGSITVRFSEPVSGVDISDFLLTRDGTNTNRLKGNETVTDTGDHKTFTINNLTSATQTLGTYVIRLRNSGTEILDAGGHQAVGQYAAFDVSLHPVGDIRVDQLGDGKVRLRFNDTNSGEDGYRIERATNPDFTKNVRTFELSPNSTSFADSAIAPATAYYYRIRGERGGKLGSPVTVNVFAGSKGEVFVDQSAAKLSGDWTTQADAKAFLQNYASASPTSELKNDKGVVEKPNTATFTARLAAGTYFAYVQYPARKSNATDTLVSVVDADGKTLYSATLDQTKRGNGWVLLSDLTNKTAGDVSVVISSKGANGNIVADAVRFLPGDQATVDNAIADQASTSSKKRTSVSSSVNA